MKTKKIDRLMRGMAASALFACLGAGCTSEVPADGIPQGGGVRIASVTEAYYGTGASASTLIPADGAYYLGYRTEVGNKLTSPVQSVTLTNGTLGETGLYWANITQEASGGTAYFTLSNVGENDQKEMLFPEKNDILWGNCSAWMKELEFVLSHRMAAVRVELDSDLAPGATLSRVSLCAVQEKFGFDRASGEATPAGDPAEMLLEATSGSSASGWTTLLPPQARTDAMELKVTVADGGQEKVYKRKLPYSMIEAIGAAESQSIPLAFRAGYRLVLTAKVTDNTDYTVFFTGATLVDWEYKGSHGVVAKPAGIYTETELKDWTVKYNAYQADKSEKNRKALLRYGVENAGSWTFTLSRNITVADKTNLTPVAAFYDTLERLNNYRIQGITQGELITELKPGASVTAGIF